MSAPARTVAIATLLAACSGVPPAPVQPPPKAPEAIAAPQVVGVKPAPVAKREPRLVRLDNGVTVTVREAIGSDAQLEFGLLSGASFVAPGVAELAAWTLIEDSDPTQGRASLRQAITALGGTVQMQLGAMTTWLDLRVPGTRWQQALTALQVALTASSQSRHQLSRMRDDLVADRSAWVRREPLLAMTRSLLLGEPSTGDYVHALLDRDPGEISLFRTRMFRPERAILALEVPGDPEAIAATLAKAGTTGFGGWRPAAPVPGATPMLERAFQGGLFWAPTVQPSACQVAIVMSLPEVSFSGDRAADLMVMHCCLTMDGTGGRLEPMLREQGLGGIRWQSEMVQTADSLAMVLRAEMSVPQAMVVWPTLQRARQSLRDVPPTASELELALRRARLTASLGQLDARSRLRAETNLQLRGQPADLLQQRFQLLDHGLQGTEAADQYLKLPAAVVIVGGIAPPDLGGAQRFELLPSGFEPETALASAATADAAANPWLDRACEAVGGVGLLRHLRGFTAELRLVHDRAPAATDTIDWQSDGTLTRTRELLGQKVITRLQGTAWSEQVGDVKKTLTTKEADQLRREYSRHPLELLAAHARGELQFRAIAQRTVGDRTLMVLEATGQRFDRLRVHIDTLSHLIRVVEVWETLADGSLLHLEETWSDYRNEKGLRAPFHRFTVQDDGENRLETVFTRFESTLRAP